MILTVEDSIRSAVVRTFLLYAHIRAKREASHCNVHVVGTCLLVHQFAD